MFDARGNELAPAVPSPDAVLREMQTQSGPSPETARAILGDEANVSPPSAPVAVKRRGVDGIERADWDKAPQ
jgi:hypothetical protein